MSKFINLILLIFFIDIFMFFVGYPPGALTFFGIGTNPDINLTGLYIAIGILLVGGLAIGITIFGTTLVTEWNVFAGIITTILVATATAPISFFAETGVPIFFKLFLGLGLGILYLLSALEWFRRGN
jgi:hypothetical protein